MAAKTSELSSKGIDANPDCSILHLAHQNAQAFPGANGHQQGEPNARFKLMQSTYVSSCNHSIGARPLVLTDAPCLTSCSDGVRRNHRSKQIA